MYELLVGIDPFTDPDPLIIYQKIIKAKYLFPKYFDHDAKSIIKHLIQPDSKQA